MKKYLNILENPDKMLFIIDEVGIGTKLIKNYGYAKKGQRVVVIFFGLHYIFIVEPEVLESKLDLHGLHKQDGLRVDSVP